MSEDNQKLRHWDQLETTDTKYTKRMTTGAKLTSINAEYQVKKFTQVFGPCGQGWGYTITGSEIVEGASMMKSSMKDADGQPRDFGPSKLHTLRLELWYIEPGTKVSEAVKHVIPATGHTPFVYMTNYGPITDLEYEKKSITDALTKAMSMLGMGGDVRMGLFDDSEYVSDLQRTEAIDQAEDKEAEIIRQRQEFDEWFETLLGLVETSLRLDELEKIFTPAKVRVKAQGSKDQIQVYEEAKNIRARELIKADREAKAPKRVES